MLQRPLALLVFAAVGAFFARDQAPPSVAEIQREIAKGKAYTFVLFKAGPAAPPPAAELEKLQWEHLRNLFAMKEEGLATLAGPFTDGGDLRGIVIFDTTDRDLVKARLDADPFVRAGLMTYEVYGWFGIPGDGIR